MNRLALLGLLADAGLPLTVCLAAASPRLRGLLSERLTARLPGVDPGAVWIHAASMGEGRVAASLARELAVVYPRIPILRTATSDAGRRQALDVDGSHALPLEAPLLHRRFIRRVRPRVLLLVEGELWPGLLLAAARQSLPVHMVAARVGPGTRRLVRWLPGLFGELGAAVASWTARDDEARGFLEPLLGRPVPVVGDLKRAAPSQPPALTWRRPALVAGSTRQGEERALLEAWGTISLGAGGPERPLLVLAPRQPSRFDAVAALLQESPLSWVRRSALGAAGVVPDVDAVLLDSMGELEGLYAGATAAFIGGTFDSSVGGHSAAEATRHGLPLVTGPHVSENPLPWGYAPIFKVREEGGLPEALAAALASPVGRPAGDAVDLAPVLEPLGQILSAPPPPDRLYRPWLWPAAPIYTAIGRLRRLKLRRVAPIPVVSVGNLASGGTGKTPVAAWLAAWFRGRGVEAAVVSRGVGRPQEGPWVRVARGRPAPDGIGDEAGMLAAMGVMVATCPDRYAGVLAAAAEGARVAVLDDGFQQRDVSVDLDLVCLDARDPGSGGPIPVGEAREPLSALGRAHLLWVNHGLLPTELKGRLPPGLQIVHARVEARSVIGADGQDMELSSLAGADVAAFAGIARPGGFIRLLREHGARVVRSRFFSDHHPYLDRELEDLRTWAGGLPVVTTEKDLARLGGRLPGVRALRMELQVTAGLSSLEALLEHVLARVREGGA